MCGSVTLSQLCLHGNSEWLCKTSWTWIKSFMRPKKLLPQLQCSLQVPCSGYLTLLCCSLSAADRTQHQNLKTSSPHPESQERVDDHNCIRKTLQWWECQTLSLIRLGSLLAITHQVPPPSPAGPAPLSRGSLVASLAELSQEKQPSSVPDFQAPTLTFIKDFQSWQDQNLSILSNLTITLKRPQHKAWGKKKNHQTLTTHNWKW